jgi:hypothetical protein
MILLVFHWSHESYTERPKRARDFFDKKDGRGNLGKVEFGAGTINA